MFFKIALFGIFNKKIEKEQNVNLDFEKYFFCVFIKKLKTNACPSPRFA